MDEALAALGAALAAVIPLHDPLWITAVGGLITACGGVAGGMFGAISAVSKSHKQTAEKLESIRELAHDAKEQTTNNHGTNLRDDIDALASRLDRLACQLEDLTAATRDGLKRLDRQLGETHDRITQIESRQTQADHTIARVDERAEREHARLLEEIQKAEHLHA